MAYLSQAELEKMEFKSLGANVKISTKSSIYSPELIEIGDNSRIDDFCVISGKLSIGSFVHIAPFCLIAGGDTGLVISDFCGISYASQVFSQSDDYSGQFLTSPLIPSHYKFEKKAQVTLEKHVIIGAHSVVLPGVILSEGSAVGAMSLVTKTTKPWSVNAGIPAKWIKSRSTNLLNLEKQFKEEFFC